MASFPYLSKLRKALQGSPQARGFYPRVVDKGLKAMKLVMEIIEFQRTGGYTNQFYSLISVIQN